ncbi:MAG: gliding motility-associated C-terminal domain-containing protein, partial [Bacteroidia bacterium]|nr:gliding motility-associated C-terminal domain-containing protein [Bacteroidia bacterium]
YLYREPGTYDVTLTTTTDSGCIDPVVIPVIVYELPDIYTTVPDTSCFGAAAVLRATSAADNQLNWYYNQTDPQPFHVGFSYATPPVVFPVTYYLEPQSPEGCVNQRIPITASVFPDEELSLVSSTDMVEMPFAVVNFGTNSTISLNQWSWNFGDGNTSDGIYEVVVKTEDINGCELTATKLIEVRKIVGVNMPSAFSPNEDGFNDTYYIGYNNLTTFNIKVFNRWGQMVFESDDPGFRWNGNDLSGVPVQEGVYVFVVQATDFDGQDITESRTVTLLR